MRRKVGWWSVNTWLLRQTCGRAYRPTYRQTDIQTDTIIATVCCRTGRSKNGSPYSITERRVLELIPVPGSQPADDVSYKPGGWLPLLSARPAVTIATLKRAATNFAVWWTEARCVWTVCLRLLSDSGCDLNPGLTAPESSTLTTRLSSHPGAEWRLRICHNPGTDHWLTVCAHCSTKQSEHSQIRLIDYHKTNIVVILQSRFADC